MIPSPGTSGFQPSLFQPALPVYSTQTILDRIVARRPANLRLLRYRCDFSARAKANPVERTPPPPPRPSPATVEREVRDAGPFYKFRLFAPLPPPPFCPHESSPLPFLPARSGGLRVGVFLWVQALFWSPDACEEIRRSSSKALLWFSGGRWVVAKSDYNLVVPTFDSAFVDLPETASMRPCPKLGGERARLVAERQRDRAFPAGEEGRRKTTPFMVMSP